MKIEISRGFGEGLTQLSAFDSALKNAGAMNYNIIHLSSVIPPKTKIKKVVKIRSSENSYGNRLYVVLSEIRGEKKGEVIGAGLGWCQYEDGRGVFVEHSAHGNSKKAIKEKILRDITKSIKTLCKNRKVKFYQNKVRFALSINTISKKPSCSLVIAKYKEENWD